MILSKDVRELNMTNHLESVLRLEQAQTGANALMAHVDPTRRRDPILSPQPPPPLFLCRDPGLTTAYHSQHALRTPTFLFGGETAFCHCCWPPVAFVGTHCYLVQAYPAADFPTQICELPCTASDRDASIFGSREEAHEVSRRRPTRAQGSR